MFENRSLRLDLTALGLFALTVFLGFALVSYDPADPVGQILVTGPIRQVYQPDVLVYPQHEKIHNACGRWGALSADLLLNGLGIGAYYLVLSLAVLDGALLRRHHVDAPFLRTIGWSASLVGLTSLAAMFTPGLSPGPVIGAGGYLGALGEAFVEAHFATLGGFILCASLVLGGLLLCTDYLVIRVLTFVFAIAYMAFHGGRRSFAQSKLAAKLFAKAVTHSSDDEDDEEVIEPDNSDASDDSASAIRIRRKKASDLDAVAATAPAAPKSAKGKADDKAAAKTVDEANTKTSTKPAAAELVDDDVQDIEDELASATDDEDEEEAVAAGTAADSKEAGGSGPHFKIRRLANKEVDRDKVMAELDETSYAGAPEEYELPGLDLLIQGDDINYAEQEKEVRRKAKILEKTFLDFGFKVRVVEIETGPVIAQYEVELEAGLRLSKITSLADDLAIALRVPSVRIVAPIPGKNSVGIEVPNEERQVVRLREVIEETNGKVKKMRIPLFLGKDVSGNALTVDLSSLPHLLIAGRTGTGKSVCLNAIISSILMTRRPDEVRMLMIDPKMVELSGYGRLPHLMHPVVTDMRKAEAILAWAVEKMEERYALLARAGVRHLSSYNQLGEDELIERLQPEDDEARKAIPLQLPYIVIVADEIADMMMTAGKEVEQHIIRLAQKSRAVGIHLILATQKPTVDVITGLIKSNLPARISFQVASRTDSRVVLDEMGADKLLGNGDMLFLWPGTSTLLRGQGTYLGDEEINKIVDHCSASGQQNFVTELVNMKVATPEGEEGSGPGPLKKRDDLYESAVDIVVREGRGSVSLLQRTLGIGYGRAARLIDFMAEDGIVGQYNGSQAREILLTLADWEKMQGGGGGVSDATPPALTHIPDSPVKKRPNKIVPEPVLEERIAEITAPGSRPILPASTSAPWQSEDFEDEFADEGNEDEGEENDLDHKVSRHDHDHDDDDSYEAESA